MCRRLRPAETPPISLRAPAPGPADARPRARRERRTTQRACRRAQANARRPRRRERRVSGLAASDGAGELTHPIPAAAAPAAALGVNGTCGVQQPDAMQPDDVQQPGTAEVQATGPQPAPEDDLTLAQAGAVDAAGTSQRRPCAHARRTQTPQCTTHVPLSPSVHERRPGAPRPALRRPDAGPGGWDDCEQQPATSGGAS